MGWRGGGRNRASDDHGPSTANRFSRETNGKIEKWFDVLEKKLKFFSSIDACVEWYNTIKPHGALDLKTPVKAYYQRMPQVDALMDPSSLEREAPA